MDSKKKGKRVASSQLSGSKRSREKPLRTAPAERSEPAIDSADTGAETVTDKEETESFSSLGIVDVLCDACTSLGWKTPTSIQKKTIPLALSGRDIIGLAQTGSGKTAAFALPMIQSLLTTPAVLAGLIMTPTRELAFQISEQFEALGAVIGLRTCVIVGGVDRVAQAIQLQKKPHIVIGTPGRVVDHLENTKGFNLKTIRYMVLDEADRMLSMDFEREIDKILQCIPKKRQTFLFSATMTSKVDKLQRASLHKPARIQVSEKYSTVDTLVQRYLFIPAKYKDTYLVYLLNEWAGQSMIVFMATCSSTQRLALMLKNLGIGCVALHGQMDQMKRLSALQKFRQGDRKVLLATDVASRGLDIPLVDAVINYDIPTHAKDYIHRVGRTARAGRSGKAVSFVTQYDVELFQAVETMLKSRMDRYDVEESAALIFHERTMEAQRFAAMEIKEKRGDKNQKFRRRKR
eukprot:TRINITY_DN399_c1_g1_i6.p1 TRINITY_DN399_c1_g1~~TRINITY_DN399_c1_g1_i6.p1  ORF type:complete len:496 (-),score=122.45 TRINITY_DN399_c1_g1_i6:665-2050(-)